MMDGSCGTHKTDEKYTVRVTKPEENRSLERSKRRWEDNIKMKVNLFRGCELDLSGSRKRQVAGSCERVHKSSGSIKCV